MPRANLLTFIANVSGMFDYENPQAGKGSKERVKSISRQEYGRRYDQIFRKDKAHHQPTDSKKTDASDRADNGFEMISDTEERADIEESHKSGMLRQSLKRDRLVVLSTKDSETSTTPIGKLTPTIKESYYIPPYRQEKEKPSGDFIDRIVDRIIDWFWKE